MVKTNYMIAFLNYQKKKVTTLGENIRYFMYKYKIYDYEWYGSINVIFKKIDSYVLSRLDEDVRCDAIAT